MLKLSLLVGPLVLTVSQIYETGILLGAYCRMYHVQLFSIVRVVCEVVGTTVLSGAAAFLMAADLAV